MAKTQQTKTIYGDGNQEYAYDKYAFFKSRRFKPHRDLLNAVLEDGRKYTIAEVDEILEKELKRKVV